MFESTEGLCATKDSRLIAASKHAACTERHGPEFGIPIPCGGRVQCLSSWWRAPVDVALSVGKGEVGAGRGFNAPHRNEVARGQREQRMKDRRGFEPGNCTS